jgi:glycosyltransferase involved in cell wall biosynthesis
LLLNPSSMMSCDFEGREFAQYLPENMSIIQENKDYLDRARSLSEIVGRARDLEPEAARPMLSACVDMCINDAEALEVADTCAALELVDLERNALLRAVFLNRDCFSALVQLAVLSLESDAPVDTVLLLSEANRVKELPQSIAPVYSELMGKFSEAPPILKYKQTLAGGNHPLPVVKRRILVVTNLFPPEELGGYGRMMWEFAFGLRRRGHEVLILTGDASYLRKPPTEDEIALEAQVSRTLRLLGEWREGVTRAVDTPQELAKLAAANARTVVQAARDFRADLILLGNSDFLGIDLLNAALGAGLPVLHALANAAPGYRPAAQPSSPRYWVAPCSDWNGRAYHQAGYHAAHVETLYPGARIDRFYRYFLPDARKLRIAYASLVMPYKGAHILIQALARLHRSRIDFVAEIAGDSTDPAFLETLTSYIEDEGMTDKVRLTGFLDRHGLSALFARSNVLVFPSQFAEPFGISQVEALAAGLVVISSGTGGACEIIRHGQDGLLFPAAEPAALAERLTLLANNPELFRDLQTRGQQRSFDFSVDRAVFKIEQLVERLLAPASAKSDSVDSNGTTLEALIKSVETPKPEAT